SARDVPIPPTQFYHGDSFRTFGPVGPYLCMLGAGDMGALKDVRLTLTVNGEVRQSDSTRNLVYGPAETLTELSGVHDLHPATSSRPARRLAPAGCALAIPSPTMQRLGGLLPDRVKWDFFTSAQAKRTVPEGRRRSGGTHQERGRCDRSRRAVQPRGRRLSQWTTVSFATEVQHRRVRRPCTLHPAPCTSRVTGRRRHDGTNCHQTARERRAARSGTAAHSSNSRERATVGQTSRTRSSNH